MSSTFVCRPGQDLIPRLRRVGVLLPDLTKCFINVDIFGVFVRSNTVNESNSFYIFQWTPGIGIKGALRHWDTYENLAKTHWETPITLHGNCHTLFLHHGRSNGCNNPALAKYHGSSCTLGRDLVYKVHYTTTDGIQHETCDGLY